MLHKIHSAEKWFCSVSQASIRISNHTAPYTHSTHTYDFSHLVQCVLSNCAPESHHCIAYHLLRVCVCVSVGHMCIHCSAPMNFYVRSL